MSDVTTLRARMSSVERAGPWDVPRQVEIRAFWGNVELDLREATLAPGVTTFDVRIAMGNVELTVPPHVEVRLEVDSVAASVEDFGGSAAAARGPLSAAASSSAAAGGASTAGGSVAGGSVAGGSVAGGSVAGGSVAGGSVAGGSVAGGSVAGGSTVDESDLLSGDPYRTATRPACVLKIVGRVRFGNLEIHRLWPGESRGDARRRERDHRRMMHGHGHGSHGWRGRGREGWHDHLDRELDHEVPGHDHEQRSRDAREFGPFDDSSHRKTLAEIDNIKDPRERRRARQLERRRRWRELHAEREMWRRSRGRGQPWVPWWLMSRIRRRMFIWLALAVGGGFAIGWRMTESPPWWSIVLGLVGLSMVSGMIAFRMTRPLIMVIKAARDIGDGKLDTRIDIDRHRGETRVLATALNDMAEKIEQQIADQRQLLAAVSHELRTPLGHMRVLVETARAGTQTRDPAASASTTETKPPNAATKSLDEIEREILVLDDLVGKLLASSRLEFGNLERRPIELGELVTDVATAAGVAPEAIEAIGDTRAAVDPTLVRRALANLIDNARVHGKGAVAVRIERRAGQVAIEVDDAGPGVSAERRADAFRAFGPSSGTAGGGSGLGLGLALVSRIAVAHGGGAWITDRPGGGARVGFAVQA